MYCIKCGADVPEVDVQSLLKARKEFTRILGQMFGMLQHFFKPDPTGTDPSFDIVQDSFNAINGSLKAIDDLMEEIKDEREVLEEEIGEEPPEEPSEEM
jgi:hypothetical protein